MADWLITSPHNENWNCRLGDCSEEHARSVLQSLDADPTCPSECVLEEIVPEPEPELEPEPEPVPEPETPAAKRLRLFRRK